MIEPSGVGEVTGGGAAGAGPVGLSGEAKRGETSGLLSCGIAEPTGGRLPEEAEPEPDYRAGLPARARKGRAALFPGGLRGLFTAVRSRLPRRGGRCQT
jgi:hypothetical protein